MLNTRSSLLIAVGSLILPLAMSSQGTAAVPALHMKVSAALLHNAQISSCVWRFRDGRPCRGKVVGVGLNRHTVFPAECRCVRTPNPVIRGTTNPDGSVEVRRPD